MFQSKTIILSKIIIIIIIIIPRKRGIICEEAFTFAGLGLKGQFTPR